MVTTIKTKIISKFSLINAFYIDIKSYEKPCSFSFLEIQIIIKKELISFKLKIVKRLEYYRR